MKKEERASISIIKIICISIILVLISGIGVLAVNTRLNDVTIILENGYEMTVLTSNTKVKDILLENNIVLTENQKTIPELETDILAGEIIKITDKSYSEVQIAKISEAGTETSLDGLLENYTPITEKIVVEQVVIPYETITKNTVSSTNTTNSVVQNGKDGLKEITYKIKYQNDIEIEKIIISEIIVTEPIDKIVEVIEISSRSSWPSTTAGGSGEIFKITAYCPCSICCGAYATGYTASGTKATAGRTVAASSQFSFGTQLVIGGNQYTVEDRGGAITGNKIDLYVNTHSEALQWGVQYLPVDVIN